MSPCVPAKEKWLETVVLSHFSLFSTSAHGSGKSALTRKIGRQFRIWPYLFVLFPFGKSSKKHQAVALSISMTQEVLSSIKTVFRTPNLSTLSIMC